MGQETNIQKARTALDNLCTNIDERMGTTGITFDVALSVIQTRAMIEMWDLVDTIDSRLIDIESRLAEIEHQGKFH